MNIDTTETTNTTETATGLIQYIDKAIKRISESVKQGTLSF